MHSICTSKQRVRAFQEISYQRDCRLLEKSVQTINAGIVPTSSSVGLMGASRTLSAIYKMSFIKDFQVRHFRLQLISKRVIVIW